MCEPISASTALYAALGASALSTGVAAYGQYQQGKFEQAQANTNAEIANRQAWDAMKRGSIAEEEHRAKVRALLGTQRATFGANNVAGTTGNPLGILAETAKFGELDALTVRNNAANEAWGYRVDAMNAKNRGQLAKSSSRYGATSTLLAGGAQAYGIWKQR